MACTQASSSNPSKKIKLTIIPPRQLFVDLTSKEDGIATPSPIIKSSSPSPPNASSKNTSSTFGTTSSSFESKAQSSPPSLNDKPSPQPSNPFLDGIMDDPTRPSNPLFDFKGIDYDYDDSSDAYSSSDEEVIDHVDFFHEGEQNVVIKNITTNDPFLTKIYSNNGELLAAIERDANNQIYPIVWEVAKVENNENWCWFLSLLQEDLELDHGIRITIISYSHKGLLDVVFDWLSNDEHMKCTRHVFANFKKKFYGVQLQRLFWLAAGTTVEQNFYNKMEQIKAIHLEAHDYLVQRNPNS
ncbi:lipopolysaccharide-modifying protein [Tanacetum coccineum]